MLEEEDKNQNWTYDVQATYCTREFEMPLLLCPDLNQV